MRLAKKVLFALALAFFSVLEVLGVLSPSPLWTPKFVSQLAFGLEGPVAFVLVAQISLDLVPACRPEKSLVLVSKNTSPRSFSPSEFAVLLQAWLE